MTVIDVQKVPESRTLTFTARFDAPPEQVWQVWADPRRLERWWGPPTYPATVVDHQLTAGGAVTYFMTGPEGEQHHGWWRILSLEPPHRLEFEDGFADDAGHPDPTLPTTDVRVLLSRNDEAATIMTIESVFPTAAAMDELMSMGIVEGMSAALDQIDPLLQN